jgi:hypothetical protein
MATKFGKWLGRNVRGMLKVTKTSAVRTILSESGLSLTALKDTAKTNAVVHETTAAERKAESQRLKIEAKALKAKADALNHAIAELDSAE